MEQGNPPLMNILAGNYRWRRDLLLEGKSIKKSECHERVLRILPRVFQDPKMGTASRLTIEENMAIALRRGQREGLAGVWRRRTESSSKRPWRSWILVLKPLESGYQYLSGGAKTGFDPSHGSSSETQTFAFGWTHCGTWPENESNGDGLDAKDCGTPSVDDFDDYPWYACDWVRNRIIMLYQGKIVVDVKGEEKKASDSWRSAHSSRKIVAKVWSVMNWFWDKEKGWDPVSQSFSYLIDRQSN